MNSRSIALLILSISIYLAFGRNGPDVRHGTIILYEKSFDQAMVVADSKYEGSHTSGIACKIDQLSADTIFFYTGNLAEAFNTKTNKIVWSQKAFAEEAYKRFKNEPRTGYRLNSIAIKYEELSRATLNQVLRGIPNREAKDEIGLGGFMSLDQLNHPTILLVNFTVQVPNDGVSPAYLGKPTISEAILETIGMGNYPPYNYADEFLFRDTPRADKARAVFKSESFSEKDFEVQRLIAAVNATLDWDKGDTSIGLPVDAVVIEPTTGIRWIQGMGRCHGYNTPRATM